jgi:putative ABC transport system permease protein
MLNHILKIATRNYIRNRSFAFINIFGLSIGLTTFILIALFVQYEFSFDQFHKKYDRIYRIQTIAHMADGDQHWLQLGYPVGNAIEDKFAEVEESVTIRPVWGQYLSTSEKLTFHEEDGMYAQQSFFDIFTVEFIEGSSEDALSEPYSIVLSESLRKKYFPGQNALGKFIKANNRYDLKVTGVIKDFPKNSNLVVDYLSPIKLIEVDNKWPLEEQWDNFSYYTIISIHEKVDRYAFDTKISDFLIQSEQFKNNPTKYTLWLNPLKDWHLLSDPSNRGLLIIVYLYAGVAIFALLIACVNFMNLTTAYSVSRAKEVGIKKVLGSRKLALSYQFLLESIIIAMVSMHIAFILAEFAMPFFNRIVSRQLDIYYIENWPFIAFIILITLATGVISGIYPAFFISSFKPVQALKNISAISNSKSPLRRILVTFQFVISSILILSTLVIYKQFIFMKNKELGFNKEMVFHAMIDPEKREDPRKLDIIQNRISSIPEITSISVSTSIPFYGSNGTNVGWEGAQPDEVINARYNFISYDFIKTFGLEIVKGRNFSKDISTDISEACIINETAANAFGWEEPLEKNVVFWDKEYRVVGVVKDFHPYSVFERIPPFIFRVHNENIDQGQRHAVRFAPGTNILEAKHAIIEIYKEFFPNTLFDFQYLGDNSDNVAMEIYQGIVRTFLFFAIITIAIAVVGMFGLVAFTTKSRTKEIGIRKVHGASAKQIFTLLAKEFIVLIIIAVIVALPAGIGFKSIDPAAYKPDSEIWEYFFTGLLVFLITLITVSFHTRKASRQNPTESLRYE